VAKGYRRARSSPTVIVVADSSALVAAYLGDELDAEWITTTLLEGEDPVVVCELADVEVPRVVPISSALVATAKDFVLTTLTGTLDTWHLAAARSLEEGGETVGVLTTDSRKGERARQLGFALLERPD
jgi:hypothetical protein